MRPIDTLPARSLSLFDAVCIITGIVIGAGIYETPPTVAACMGGPGGVMAVWLAGGLLAMSGALCYAELAATYPHQGGDYVYLNRAYGPWAGFLFGWCQLAIIRPGDIALMAFIFARYATTLYAPAGHMPTLYAAGTVAVLTAINVIGVRAGKWTQNLLTIIKVGGLLLVATAGFLAPGAPSTPPTDGLSSGGLKLALILVLFTYGGWNEMAYVAAEIKRPQKNILRALVFGTAAVAAIYLLLNAAFLHALGFNATAGSSAVAVDTVATLLPNTAVRLISVMVCLSALGAVNGMIFTGARISYAMGAGHRIFRRLGKWHPRLGTPVAALLWQGILSLGIVLLAGSFIDTILYSAPAVWLFFLATAIALFRLRKIDAGQSRPCRVFGYPFTPLFFCAACAFMLYNSTTYALVQKPAGLMILAALLAAGLALYYLQRKITISD